MTTDENLPDRYDIKLVQGDDYVLDVEVEEGGATVDFTGHSDGLLQVRERPGAELLSEYTSSGALTMGAGGRVTLTFPSADTKQWPNKVEYEFQSTKPNGNVQTYIKGTIFVQSEVAQ